MPYHLREGFYFSRGSDGEVTITVKESAHSDAPVLRELTVAENEWASSAVASVSARGDCGEAWREALELHVRAPA